MLIRAERRNDKAAIYEVNVSAFETPAEAELVDALREQAEPFISLVAEDADEIIGHIVFSPVSLPADPKLKVMGLAPMAVTPEHQHKGVGSTLVRAGLERCKEMGFSAVVVLGHPEYYPRFGFLPATRFGLHCEYKVPNQAFMAMELEPGALDDKPGMVKYHAAFGNV
jgi:putative acetyltransferase